MSRRRRGCGRCANRRGRWVEGGRGGGPGAGLQATVETADRGPRWAERSDAGRPLFGPRFPSGAAPSIAHACVGWVGAAGGGVGARSARPRRGGLDNGGGPEFIAPRPARIADKPRSRLAPCRSTPLPLRAFAQPLFTGVFWLPPRWPSRRQDVCMVSEPVEQRGCQLLVAEDLHPFAKSQVRCHDR